MGLIPAYAGSTDIRGVGHDVPRAHPRLRGEHSIVGYLPRVCDGSSPLTRGARAAPSR